MPAERVPIDTDPFPNPPDTHPFAFGQWPGRWVACPGASQDDFVAAYRLRFSLDAPARPIVHVSADQRYELWLDGQRVGRGPERSSKVEWFFESYRLDLAAGEHVLVARVWSAAARPMHAPAAQVSFDHAFLLVAEAPLTETLSTGLAGWDALPLTGHRFDTFAGNLGGLAGGVETVDAADLPPGWRTGEGDGWQAVNDRRPPCSRHGTWGSPWGRFLRPAALPAMVEAPRQIGRVRHLDAPTAETLSTVPIDPADHLADETPALQAVLAGDGNWTLPPHTRRRAVIDLDDYYCAYPELVVSGGAAATLELHWAESLYHETDGDGVKGNRDEVAGKVFYGKGDRFRPAGRSDELLDTLWWRCGRYLQLHVTTGDEPVTIRRLTLRETRYPLERTCRFSAEDGRLEAIIPLLWRALQMCSHESYMDCPFYEQLQYAGDTRVEVLTTYVGCKDNRLPRKALRMFGSSRWESGLTLSNFPNRGGQCIPQFSLYWVAMVHDWAMWQDQPDVVAAHLPGVRSVLETFLARIDDDGLLEWPEGWDWIDWTVGWRHGRPELDASRRCGINHLQLLYVLGLAIQIEEVFGEPELALRLSRVRANLTQSTFEAFWDEGRALFATTPSRNHFAEHAQCLAVLAGIMDADRQGRLADALCSADDLDRATVYFRHYLFETFFALGRPDEFLDRLDLWFGLAEQGFKTTVEAPEPSRSDCHAWGAHPLYHYLAGVLGIRPGSPGFATVRIRPQLGRLSEVAGTMPHPRGEISAEFRREASRLTGQITLPEGVCGVLATDGEQTPLQPGRQEVDIAAT